MWRVLSLRRCCRSWKNSSYGRAWQLPSSSKMWRDSHPAASRSCSIFILSLAPFSRTFLERGNKQKDTYPSQELTSSTTAQKNVHRRSLCLRKRKIFSKRVALAWRLYLTLQNRARRRNRTRSPSLRLDISKSFCSGFGTQRLSPTNLLISNPVPLRRILYTSNYYQHIYAVIRDIFQGWTVRKGTMDVSMEPTK